MVRPHLRVAALVFAALGLGACDSGRDERDGSTGAGITLVQASEETRSALGVVSWDVRPLDANRLAITGMDGGQTDVVGFLITTTAEQVTIEAHGLSSGRLVIAADGTVTDDSLSDADALLRFQQDGEAKLVDAGYRISAQCAADLTAAQGICGMALMSGNPIQVLQCGVAMAKAATSCFGGMGGMGMPGGGSGGMPGGGSGGSGGYASGGYASGGYGSGGSGGYGSGGYGSGGYGSGGYGSGGYGSGGYGSGGYGSGGYGSGGYGSGGYEEGGYEEGGYGEGGYGEGGYGEGGYGEGGYYNQPGPRRQARLHRGGIPSGAQTVGLTFAAGESGVRAADPSRWNLLGPV